MREKLACKLVLYMQDLNWYTALYFCFRLKHKEPVGSMWEQSQVKGERAWRKPVTWFNPGTVEDSEATRSRKRHRSIVQPIGA